MENQTESYQLNQPLILYKDRELALNFPALTLIITKQDETLQQCHLTGKIDYEFYQKVAQFELFNFKLDARIPLSQNKLSTDKEIALLIELRPDFLPKLTKEARTAEELANYLTNLGLQPELSESANYTENWYCLSVKQQQGSSEIGYRTLWDYANLSTINQIVNAGNEVAGYLTTLMKEIGDSLPVELQSNSEAVQANLSSFLQELEQEESEDAIEYQPVSEVIREFFDEDDWNYVQLEDGNTLQMSYQGDNGRWTCYASPADESQRFMFYSVAPLDTPPNKISTMVEFLTKANYGLMIGNFEIDFNDGEIRYKTSIDVENNQLTTNLVKNLVYVNVETMDNYLPGIVGILNNQLSPDEAIAKIEAQTAIKETEGE
ncbi:YbjN domain-containing protein [[Phormidium ambiguum] IAM M-71]|uniref:YbjN domain-containing protein n=1 Tax=[Phormidium ambiguum] IAM M-71 TaxID=454136 RepID=UPI000937C36D|nr:YbjN domain-containing protein [Phormidium ambiguum]